MRCDVLGIGFRPEHDESYVPAFRLRMLCAETERRSLRKGPSVQRHEPTSGNRSPRELFESAAEGYCRLFAAGSRSRRL